MFAQLEYEVVEELKFGDPKNPGTWLRLEVSERGNHVIRLWSGSGRDREWKVMYRYNVEENWNSWKKIFNAKLHSKKPKGRKSRSDDVVVGTPKSPRKKSKPKASAKHTTVSKTTGKHTRKNK